MKDLYIFIGQTRPGGEFIVEAAQEFPNPDPWPIAVVQYDDETAVFVDASGDRFFKYEHARNFFADWAEALRGQGYVVRAVTPAFSYA